jgi:uncharacterized protein YqfA (UPF0365 family)
MPSPFVTGILIAAGIVALIVLYYMGKYLSLWFQAYLSGAHISLLDIVIMRFRRVHPSRVVFCIILARKAGLDLTVDQIKAHVIAGGRAEEVVRAMIAAREAGIELDWDRAVAIDLAGEDLFDRSFY